MVAQPKTADKSGLKNALAGVIAFGTLSIIVMVLWVFVSGYDITTWVNFVIVFVIAFILTIMILVFMIAGWKRGLGIIAILAAIFVGVAWGIKTLAQMLLI